MLMEYLFTLVWMLGVSFSIYETTVHFKVHCAEKITMMYKAESGGLQADALCRKLQIYQMFMCNDPEPKIYLAKSLSPLCAGVVELFVYV